MDEEVMEVVEGDDTKAQSALLEALHDGTFYARVGQFDDKAMASFVPYLTKQAFSLDPVGSVPNEHLINLKRRLNRFPAGGLYLKLTDDVNFPLLIFEAQELKKKDLTTINNLVRTNFETADAFTKLNIVATYILYKIERRIVSITQFDPFVPFDVGSYHDEVITILTILTSNFGHIVRPLHVVRLLLGHAEGLRLFNDFILNVPSLNLSDVMAVITASGNAEPEFIKNQRMRFVRKLLSLDRRLPYETLHRMRENIDANFDLFVDILTHTIPTWDFVSEALPTLLREDRRFVTLLRKIAHQKQAILFVNRLDYVVTKASCHRKEKHDLERLVILVAFVLCANFNKLISNKLDNWIKFLTYFDESLSQRYLRAALSAICACNLSSGSQFESSVTGFFQNIKNLLFSDISRYRNLNQLMLLLSIHFNTNDDEQVNQLLSSELGFKITSSFRRANVRTLYLRHAMAERDVAESAAKIDVTRGLTEHTTGYLPAHCVNHLLQGKIFSKHQIGIQAWIERQLLECKTPIHPIMGHLLHSYAASCIPSPESPSCNQPLNESFLTKVFSGDIFDSTRRATRILGLYFLLSYNTEHHLFQIRVVSGPRVPPKDQPNAVTPAQLDNNGWHRRTYSEALLALIPIRYLLSVVEADPHNYQPIRAELIRMVSHMMPYMLPAIDALLEGNVGFLDGCSDSPSTRVSSARLTAAFDEIERTGSNVAAGQLLAHLEHAPLRTLSTLQTAICHGMKSTLDSHTSERVIEVITGIWERLEMVQPRKLYDETIKQWIAMKNVDSQAASDQPLILFRCDRRIFQSAHHLKCLIRMLNFHIMACNSNFINKKDKARPNDGEERDDRQELMNALTGAQYSAIVQVLISICNNASDRVQKVIGDQIHQMFITEPNVSRLVHYQTYPLHLVSVVVKVVPSMHIMIEHVHELLCNSKLQRRVFGIVLMAELAHQYKIPSSLQRVELIVDVVHTLLSYMSTDYNIAMFLEIVPSLGSLMRLFPQVAAPISDLLMRVSMIAQTRAAVTATVIHKRNSSERKLIQMIETQMHNSIRKACSATK